MEKVESWTVSKDGVRIDAVPVGVQYRDVVATAQFLSVLAVPLLRSKGIDAQLLELKMGMCCNLMDGLTLAQGCLHAWLAWLCDERSKTPISSLWGMDNEGIALLSRSGERNMRKEVMLADVRSSINLY